MHARTLHRIHVIKVFCGNMKAFHIQYILCECILLCGSRCQQYEQTLNVFYVYRYYISYYFEFIVSFGNSVIVSKK